MTVYLSSWKYRRRVVFGALLWIAAIVSWIAIVAAETAMRTQIALALIGLAAAIIGSYVFGAAWDDRNAMLYGRPSTESTSDKDARVAPAKPDVSGDGAVG